MTGSSDLRADALEIFRGTLEAIDVERVVREYVRIEGERLAIGDEEIDLSGVRRIVLVGIGKACLPAGRALEEILGDRLTAGLLATNAIVGARPRSLGVHLGGHPAPNEASLEAAREALALLRASDDEQTLAIFIVTGGGSAQFEQPIADWLTLDDLRAVNQALVECGAVIGEMNVVRRRLSAVKGGRLAGAAPRARQVSLYVSDVNSDDLRTVASGPTLASGDTNEDFEQIVARYVLLARFPPRIAALIGSGSWQSSPLPAGARRSHHLLLDNRRAMAEARRLAEARGYACEVEADLVEGAVEEMTREHLRRLAHLRRTSARVCLISGGEAICPVRGSGEGGRNQEFVLRAALNLSGDLAGRIDDSILILSAGTDGIDGRSPAAGAIADGSTIERARALGLDPADFLARSDSYNFFRRLGDVIVTGPTGNNVRDLRLLMAN